MPAPQKTIDHGTLRRLVHAGAHIGADVVGAVGGWGVVINYGLVSPARCWPPSEASRHTWCPVSVNSKG